MKVWLNSIAVRPIAPHTGSKRHFHLTRQFKFTEDRPYYIDYQTMSHPTSTHHASSGPPQPPEHAPCAQSSYPLSLIYETPYPSTVIIHHFGGVTTNPLAIESTSSANRLLARFWEALSLHEFKNFHPCSHAKPIGPIKKNRDLNVVQTSIN